MRQSLGGQPTITVHKHPKGQVVTVAEFLPGDEVWLASDSPTSQYSAIFEDDGETGYFYAYERTESDGTILDAVHIYNVRNVVDREIPSVVRIIWSADGLKAALLLNGPTFPGLHGYDRHQWLLMLH